MISAVIKREFDDIIDEDELEVLEFYEALRKRQKIALKEELRMEAEDDLKRLNDRDFKGYLRIPKEMEMFYQLVEDLGNPSDNFIEHKKVQVLALEAIVKIGTDVDRSLAVSELFKIAGIKRQLNEDENDPDSIL